jgi:glycosyltransferase involved in cell wall biosynthesis
MTTKNMYSKNKLIFIRSSNQYYDPRLQTSIKMFSEDLDVVVIDWNREKLRTQTDHTNFRVISFALPAKYNTGFRNLARMFRWQVFIAKQLIRERPSIIWAIDLDTAITGLLISKLIRSHFVFEEYDNFEMRLGKSFVGIFRKINKKLADKSDLCVYPSINRLKQKTNHDLFRRNYPIWYATSSSLVQKRTKMRAAYIGVLNKDRLLETIQKAFKEKIHWNLSIAGFGDERLVDTTQSNVVYHGSVPPTNTPALLNGVSLYFAFYSIDILNNVNTASNKAIEAAILKIPIVTNSGTQLAESVDKYGLGWVVKEPYEIGIVSAINEFESMTNEQLLEIENNLENFHKEYASQFESEMTLIQNYVRSWCKVK